MAAAQARMRMSPAPWCAARHPPWSLAHLHRARGISQTYLAKVEEGEQRWKARASKIKTGELPHLWDILHERGFIKDVAGDPEQIKKIMLVKRIGAYVGIDPTADSLHLGHLVPIMALLWMWVHGHPAVTLIGGSTARIGDPTGRVKTREDMSNSDISKNITKIHYQLTKLWQNANTMRDQYRFEKDWAAKHALLNNSMWLQKVTMYDFSKRILRQTRIGPMLSRDAVKSRLNNGEGMSLGEFIYPLFQGWDFWHMYNKIRIQMQIGGSDQYGNIVSGIEIVKTIRSTEEAPFAQMPTDWRHNPVGFTVPLLTDSAGVKYGKTEGNALWLDPFKTSAYDLYGFCVRRSDDEVEKFLKLLTFKPMDDIKAIMEQHRASPEKRVAQHTLAFEVLSFVHGSRVALQEANQHKIRFGGGLDFVPDLPLETQKPSGIIDANNAPRSDIQLPRSAIELSPTRLIFATGLAETLTEAQRLVTQQAAYVAAQPGQTRGLVPGNLNWTPIKMWFPGETERFLIDDKLLILRKGKHNVRIVELVSEEDWKATGKIYPGQPNTGVVRRIKEQLKEEFGTTKLKPKALHRLAQKIRAEDGGGHGLKLPSKVEYREHRWMRRGKVNKGG